MIRISKKPDGTVTYDCATESEFQIVQRELTNGHSRKHNSQRPTSPRSPNSSPRSVNVGAKLTNGAAKLFAALTRNPSGEITSEELRKALGVSPRELATLFKELREQLHQRAQLKLSDIMRRNRLIREKRRVRVYTFTKKGEKLVKDMRAG